MIILIKRKKDGWKMAKKDLKKENIEAQELNDDNLDNVSGGRVHVRRPAFDEHDYYLMRPDRIIGRRTPKRPKRI